MEKKEEKEKKKKKEEKEKGEGEGRERRKRRRAVKKCLGFFLKVNDYSVDNSSCPTLFLSMSLQYYTNSSPH